MACLNRGEHTAGYYFEWLRAIIDMIIIFLILSSNSLIIVSVIRYWRRHSIPCSCKTATMLTINLCFADTLFICIKIYKSLPSYLCGYLSNLELEMVPCVLKYFAIMTADLASGFTLFAIIMDRYMATMHPVRHLHLSSARRCLTVVLFIWIFAVLGAASLFVWNNWTPGISCREYNIFPLAFSLIISPIRHFIIVSSVVYVHWCIHRVTVDIKKIDNSNLFSTKAGIILMIILICYTITWSPYTFSLILLSEGIKIPSEFIKVAVSLVNVNYLSHAFIYTLNLNYVRKAILSIFRVNRPEPITEHRETTTSNDLSLSQR